MGRLATYIAIEGARVDQIWDLSDDIFRAEFLKIEEDDSLNRFEIGKIWDALHCTFTGKPASEPIEGNRLSESIVGTYPKLYEDEDYSVFVSVIDNNEIVEIIEALAQFDRTLLDTSLNLDLLESKKIYPSGIWNTPREDLIDEMHFSVQSLITFLTKISNTELHILATIL